MLGDIRKILDIIIRAKDETAPGVNSSSSTISKMLPILGRLSAGVTGAFSVKILADFSTEIHKTSMQLGIAYDEMQRLAYAGRILDVDMRNVANAILEIQRRGPEAAGALATVGLTMETIRTGRPTEILAQIADGLGRIEDVTIRQNVAFQLFGRSYKEMLAVFAEGGDQIRKIADETPTIPDRVIRDFDRAGDAIDALKTKALALLGVLLDWRRTDAEFMQGVGQVLGIGAGTTVGPSNIERLRSLGALGGGGGSVSRTMSLADVPTETSNIFSDINQPTQDRLRAVQDELRARSLALRLRGSQIGGAGMRVGGSLRGMEFAGPVGMFPESAEEEKQNKMLEERVGHLANLRDKYDALRDGIQEVEIQAESLGATLVDGAFRWADAWSQGLALVQTKQAEFSDVAKRLFRAMIADMLAWINRLIARQIVSAVLSSIIGGGGGNVAGAIQAATAASGGGGAVPMGLPESSRAFRPPTVATGDFGRSVTLNANISATFASQGEMRAAAVQLVRMAQAEFAR